MLCLTGKPPIHRMTFKSFACNHVCKLVKAVDACISDSISVKVKCNPNRLPESLNHFPISLVWPVLFSPLVVSCGDSGATFMFKSVVVNVFKVHNSNFGKSIFRRQILVSQVERRIAVLGNAKFSLKIIGGYSPKSSAYAL